MPGVTDAVKLSWQIAADEGIRSGHLSIEPLHLLIGICSTGKFLDPQSVLRTKMQVSVFPRVNLEWQQFSAVLAAKGVDPAVLRRVARTILGHSERNDASPPTKLGRSEPSRRIFDGAEQIARKAKREVVSLIDLFVTILSSDDPSLTELIAACALNAG